MLSNTEKIQLRQLMHSPQWSAFEHLAQEVSNKIREEPVIFDTEWQTLKSTLMREGGLRAIQRLIQETYLQVQSIKDDTA